ncbi:LytR C-terminal domain-containing protein [uncultured Microbacterium sp.]|uniref:LytR C-terminal domain-containing protein n=1 Tax=uncultured Microbacterium sp. TaxID=191216 RepID=UPI0025DB27E6|nr:LytR C-terminal domain-containing protein [uncultured Microbacterium sp.]
MPDSARDRFDEIPHSQGRVGAHRAENPGMHGWFVLLWALIATVVLVGVGIFGAMIAMDKISFGPDPVVPSRTPTPTATTPALDTTFAVFVLNGTTADGLAASTRDKIVNAGFPAAAVATADASQQDFPVTTVYYVNAADKAGAEALAALLGATKVAQSDAYSNDVVPDQKQLTVVLGADQAANAPAPPQTPSGAPSDGSDGGSEG